MPMGILFWVLMILWFIFGFLSGRTGWEFWGEHGLTFVLFALLGWKCFGKPIQG